VGVAVAVGTGVAVAVGTGVAVAVGVGVAVATGAEVPVSVTADGSGADELQASSEKVLATITIRIINIRFIDTF
jgi:hypothetical protein